MRTAWFVLVGLVVTAAPALAEELKVALLEISEQRHKSFRAKEQTGGFPSATPQLTLRLEFAGPSAEAVTHWGRFEVKTATLAPEGKLEARADAFQMEDDEFVEIDREHMFFGREEQGKDRLELSFDFAAPPRRAQRIARLEAEVTLRTSAKEHVVVEKFTEQFGRKIEHPALKKAGVEVELRKSEEEPNVELALRGDHRRIQELDVLDTQGESLTSGTWSMWSDAERTVQLMLDKAAPADAKLRITVATAYEDVTVPIRLEDVELP